MTDLDFFARPDFREDCVTPTIGDCIISDHTSHLYIVQADPRIKITGYVVDLLRQGDIRPEATLVDDVLTIRGTNRTVIYRLGEYDPLTRTYSAEWPD